MRNIRTQWKRNKLKRFICVRNDLQYTLDCIKSRLLVFVKKKKDTPAFLTQSAEELLLFADEYFIAFFGGSPITI